VLTPLPVPIAALLAVLLGLVGAAWGVVADRIAARWPEHVHEHVHDHSAGDAEHAHDHSPDDEPVAGKAWAHEHPHEHRPGLGHGVVRLRGLDWRTLVVAAFGAVALGLVPLRHPDPAGALLVGTYLAALVLLLATDLDQRLLPDVVTLPLAGLVPVVTVLGWNPFVAPGSLPVAALVAVAVPALLYLLSLPFARGAFGMGDVKLLVSAGLLVGPSLLLSAVVVGVFLAGAAILVLLAARRITLKTFIPYGPFLILGTAWALLVLGPTG
jgi:leader peptidase (prepilin peptidase)/N-methyltransferase